MQYSAQHICEAFNTANEKVTWHARPNSRDDADVAIFTCPSDVIELSYDAIERRFVVRFVKANVPFRTYMLAVAKAFTYVLECLAQGGLPFAPPPSASAVEVRCSLRDDGAVSAWWSGMYGPQKPSLSLGGETIELVPLFEEPLNEDEENNTEAA